MSEAIEEVTKEPEIEIAVPEHADNTVSTIVGDHIVFVGLHHDEDISCPDEDDQQWKLYSFNTRHRHHTEDVEQFKTIGFRRKLEVGLAFVLGYFEHGNSAWHISGQKPPGTEGDYRWDGREGAGVLVWEHDPSYIGAKTKEDRENDAKGFLEVFNAWTNGEGYGYVVRIYKLRKADGSEIYDDERDYRYEKPIFDDSCWGFYGDDINRGIAEALGHAREELQEASA